MKSFKTILCGTGYGATYLPILAGTVEFNLSGIFSRGSEKSLEYSSRLNVPCFTETQNLPNNIDLSVVAISNDAGADLAKHFLLQGTHVLLEHPIGPDQLEELLYISKKNKKNIFINSHFRYTYAISKFIELIKVQEKKPHSVVVSTSLRTLFSTLDILIDCFGKPSTQDIIFHRNEGYLQCIIELQSCTILLNLQSWKHNEDSGSDVCMGHSIQAFYTNKSIQISNTWGPVIEQYQPMQDEVIPLIKISDELSTLPEVLTSRRTANRNILLALRSTITTGEIPHEQEPDFLLSVARLYVLIINKAAEIELDSE